MIHVIGYVEIGLGITIFEHARGLIRVSWGVWGYNIPALLFICHTTCAFVVPKGHIWNQC